MKALLNGLVLCLIFITVVSAAEIKVVDGDSLFIGKREIRLSGIDAPEYKQECFDAGGKSYRCGLKALEYLKSLVNASLRCEVVAVDRYHRDVSVCYEDGRDINAQMVSAGWAVAYTRYIRDYEDEEAAARLNRRGIWQGRFMKPELYRVLHH